ncbi:60S ribosomal protein L6, variant 2 [Schistosoma haematobium]|uniref:Large ribosomal subunit protein eL6 n=1 Tax=Schistosoma haematobium TaxID=6185 RepID=A0A095AF58_SCHHA|nr:60S ribosomal protein L6, variant 2 [Schistosoma haematobium]KAH9579258.1 60S ribosomal protein L6, variant 2 [Schistosoma haematobium]CAH8630806.1 unnamed protein product [Schistosoma haematobium]
MAEFRKCFENLDTEKRGVITIEDLKNYMYKMHYKETFLHKWIELFDPEHTGFITYEQYCKTLGLIPRKRTLSKNLTDSTLLSSSSSLSISSKQDNVNEAFIGSFDKNVNETNIVTIIQQSDSNEPDQKIEQTIITTEQHSTIHIQIDQTIKNTCTLKQSKVEINETEQQQQQNEFPNQLNNPIHQNINNDSTNLTMINNQNIITVNDEYIDENMITVKENIISPINNDILLKNTEQMITDLIVSNENENKFIESLKQIDIEMNNELKSSIEQTQLSITDPIKSMSSDKKSIKKSKKKQKNLLSLEKNISDIIMDTNLLLPIENITLDSEHNEFISSIITQDINNSGINITDVTYTTTTTTSSIQNEISSLQFNINDNQSSINNVLEIDPQYNKEYIENSMKHLKKTQKSINKEKDLKEQYETNIQPLNSSFISESADSEHNEPSDITLSSIEISIHKEDPISLHVLQYEKPMSTSTHLLNESNQFTECCLSNETNQETDSELDHEIIHNDEISKQTIEKSNKKSSKKKETIYNPLGQTIDQEILINDPVHFESIGLINQQSSQFITESLPTSELLIIPQEIQSISKTPQGINEEADTNDNNNVELLSPPELISDEKNFEKGSKKSRKKHEKKNSDIEQDSCIIVNEVLPGEKKMMKKKKKEKKNTTDSKNDHLQEVNMFDMEMTSESINKEYINPSVMSFSDPTFLELNSTNSQSECCIEQTSNKQHTIILETNNSSEQVLNESQMNISNDNTVHTEITHISSTIPVDDHDETSEYIEKVQFNNNDNDTLVEQSSLRKGDISEMSTELTLCDTELNIEHQDTNKNSLKQSKKKQKKTKQLIEKNIKVVESHKNTTNTSIPQSIATTIDINRTVDSPLSTDIKITEQTQQLIISLSSNDLVSQPSDGFSKKSSSNKKTKKVKIQSNVSDDNYFSKSTSTILPNSLIPVNEVNSTEYSNSSSSGRNTKNNFTSISIPFCKTICKVSHDELQNSLSHRNTSNLKAKNKKLHLTKNNKLKSSETIVPNQLDDKLNNKSVINEITMGQSSKTVTEEETQENTRKRRFPKSFITQVDPKYIRSARLAAKRRKTDSTNKPKETSSSSSTDKRKTSIKQESKKILKKWRLRPSLRENGVIVILLAGRHRGKRVVSLGRQKSTGLLLVTGPYCYNGCPLRRVHPDYVIATKTKIDLSSLSLPERIHTKKYFTRTTKCKSFKTKHNHNHFDEILEHGINTERSAYKPNDERKTDQIYIDNEVRKAIKSHTDSKLLIGYLKSLFSIGKHDKPHEMLF